MKTSKDKILEALGDLLPADTAKEVTEAVDSFLQEAKAELDKEYDAKIAEAYEAVTQEKLEGEKIAEQGYAEAYQIISDLRDRLEVQREEFEQALEEGYEEAYQMLVQERTKNESLEVDLYEEYDKRLADIKEYMVDKLDAFLSTKGNEFYEQAKRDVLNDPMMAEHKIALEKILEVASSYMSEEDYHLATSSKVEELAKQLEELKGQQRILEAKNMRLATENGKLNEAVRQQNEVLTENVNHEKKERLKKAKAVEGRGQKSLENQVVIGESVDARTTNNDEEHGTRFVETSSNSITEQWRHLAGVESPSSKK
jgi:putative NIF3 family GTP cyclohydrolase 1 type 2